MRSNMIITKKDCRISIDTMELTAKLNYKELQELRNYFDSDKSSQSDGMKNYESVYHLKKYGFTMKVLPRIKEWRRHYNTRITLQTTFFEAERVPFTLLDLLHMFDWSITYLQVAFDYRTKPLVMKHHYKLAYEKLVDDVGHVSEYFGSRGTKKLVDCEDKLEEKWIYRKNNIAILYDRNEKEMSKGIIDEPRHEYSKRYEARMKFKMGEFSLFSDAHYMVARELDKRLVVGDLENSAIHEYQKRPLRKLHGSLDDLKWLNTSWLRDGKNPSKEYKTLLNVVRDNKEPLADMYLEHCQELFSVFDYVENESVTTELFSCDEVVHLLNEINTFKIQVDSTFKAEGDIWVSTESIAC